jgi:hypothetical protein
VFTDGESVAAALAGRPPEKITQVGGFIPRECLSWRAQRAFGLCSFACAKFRSFAFPLDLSALGVGAFCCSSLESVDIPDSVREVGSRCFAFCHKLKKVSLGNGLSEIAEEMFEDCFSLELVRLPPRVRKVGKSAFASTRSLRAIDLSSLQPGAELGGDVFRGSGLVSVTFARQSRVLKIPECMFSHCFRLERVELCPEVSLIGSFAFYRCRALRRIDLSSLTADAEIGSLAFWRSGLVEVDLPAKLRKIGTEAFSECHSLVSVRLPQEVGVIRSKVFKRCESLRSLALGDVRKWNTKDFCPLKCIERLELIGTRVPSDKANDIERWLADGTRVVSTRFAGKRYGRFVISSV